MIILKNFLSGLSKITLFAFLIMLASSCKEAKVTFNGQKKDSELILKKLASSISSQCPEKLLNASSQNISMEDYLKKCFINFKLLAVNYWPIPEKDNNGQITSSKTLLSFDFNKEDDLNEIIPIQVSCQLNGKKFNSALWGAFVAQQSKSSKINLVISGLTLHQEYNLSCSLMGGSDFSVKIVQKDPVTFFENLAHGGDVSPAAAKIIPNFTFNVPDFMNNNKLMQDLMGMTPDSENTYNDLLLNLPETRKADLQKMRSSLKNINFLSTLEFDEKYIVTTYPELNILFSGDLNAIQKYFSQYGIYEGKRSSPFFNVNALYAFSPYQVIYQGQDSGSLLNKWFNGLGKSTSPSANTNGPSSSSVIDPHSVYATAQGKETIDRMIDEITHHWTDKFGFLRITFTEDASQADLDNENPVLFTSEYYFMLKKLGALTGNFRQEQKQKVLNMMALLRLENGLFNRFPASDIGDAAFITDFSRDEQIGLVTLDWAFDYELGFSNELMEYGEKNNYKFENRNYGTDSKGQKHIAYIRDSSGDLVPESELGIEISSIRWPETIEYFRLASNKHIPSDLGLMATCAALKTEADDNIKDTSGKILAILRTPVLEKRSIVLDQCLASFHQRIKAMYGENPLQKIFAIYFTSENHPFHQLSSLKSMGETDAKLIPNLTADYFSFGVEQLKSQADVEAKKRNLLVSPLFQTKNLKGVNITSDLGLSGLLDQLFL